MCQCGCSEYPIEQGYQLPNGNVIGISIYHGCRDCFPGPAVDVSVFANRKTEWLESAEMRKFKPDEYGGKTEGWQAIGIPIPLFEVQDLVAACKEFEGEEPLDDSGYASVSEWLADNGLEMIQNAMRRFSARMAEMEKKRKAGKGGK